VENVFSAVQAQPLISCGAAAVAGDLAKAAVQVVAIRAYQLQEAHRRLKERGYSACVTYVCEPGRFREGRDGIEGQFVVRDDDLRSLSRQKCLASLQLTRARSRSSAS
jgi:hypothetical protein